MKLRPKILCALAGVGALAGFCVWLFVFSSGTVAPSSADGVDPERSLLLQVPLEQTIEARAELVEALVQNRSYHNRELFEQTLDAIGANGVVQSFEDAYQGVCHDEAHDFGKVLYARLQNIGDAFAACENVCQSGCMHGVTMEFLATEGGEAAVGEDEHVDREELVRAVDRICDTTNLTADYKLGDCVHGVGHALMFLADYDVDEAIESCGGMSTDVLDYYCATGAYMEYMISKTASDHFDVCTNAAYPAACFRYQMSGMMRTYYASGGTFNALVNQCLALEGGFEVGCFHGIGNGHLQYVVAGEAHLDQLCQYGDTADQYVCIEGLMERLARYFPELVSGECSRVSGWQNELCLSAAKRELYDLEKPFEYYVK